jgi:hypothetical protein
VRIRARHLHFMSALQLIAGVVRTEGEASVIDREGETWSWESGGGEWVQIGRVNRNDQRCCGHRGVPGTDHGQLSYKVECLRCGFVYGANGSDMHERLCPECQDGATGIRYWGVAETA